MKKVDMDLMPIVLLLKMKQGFIMSHGDHNHYFFKKDLTADQIKAAQDHLKVANTTTPAHDDDHDEDNNGHHHDEGHDHGFDANRVISEDEQGFVMSHGDHNHFLQEGFDS